MLPTMSLGGGAVAAIDLALAMSRLPETEVRFCVLGPPANLAPERAAHLETRYLGVTSVSRIRGLLLATRSLSALVKEWSVNIIHTHLLPADLVGALAASIANVRHFAHLRDTRDSLTSARLPDRIRRALHRLACSIARTDFVAVSNDAGEYNRRALDIDLSRLHVVVDGIDTSRIPDLPTASRSGPRFRVGCAGRFVLEKGHGYVISALAELTRAEHEVEFHLAGSGSLETALREQAERLGVGDRFTIVHNVEDMASFYRSLDAFILPSTGTEGLPLVVMEAMAAGCPVIATDTTGINDVIRHDANGLVVRAGSATDIADAVLSLMQDDAMRTRLAEAGRQAVRAHHTIERVACETRALYEKAV